MIENLDENIDLNLRILSEARNNTLFAVNFKDVNNKHYLDREKLDFAKIMEDYGLIRINAGRCVLQPFGKQIYKAGGWIKYLKEKKESNITFSEKKRIVLLALYEYRFNDNYYHVSAILERENIQASLNEIVEICDSLESEQLIRVIPHENSDEAAITAKGVQKVEEYHNSFSEYSPPDKIPPEEQKIITKRLDELLERITKLEVGQQITYDDLQGEINELKSLVKVLGKKNFFEVVKGKCIDFGLGELFKGTIETLTDVFRDRFLPESM